MRHHWYNRESFPHFVVNHGSWDICADASGYCAAIPTAEAEARGCKASHFGDMAYVRATLARELAEQERALYPYGKHLPIFHTPDSPMSQDAAERAAERYMDRADRALLAGQATQEHYAAWCGALDAWVKRHTA